MASSPNLKRQRSDSPPISPQKKTRLSPPPSSEEQKTFTFQIGTVDKYQRQCTEYKKPQEIGCFSFDSTHTYHQDDSELKYYYPPDLAKCNLSDGYDSYISKEGEGIDPLDAMLRCLMNVKVLEDDEFRRNVAVVTWRGIMTKILCAPYSRDDPWELGAELCDGTIYIEEYLTPKRIAQNSQQSPRQKLMSYWGYKFESLSTLPTNIPPSQLSPEQMKTYLAERKSSVVNTNIQYCSVVKTKLGKHGIIVGAEVDCVEESKSTDKKRSDCYVELKTNKMIMSDRDERNFERFKMLRIWAQSFLAGIPKIVVGFRDHHGNVRSVQEFKTLELPRLVRGKPDMWDPTVCLNFAHDFLTFLRQVITESNYQVIEGNLQRQKVEYTISYNPAEGNHISVKKIMKLLETSADTEKERSSKNEQEDKKLSKERGEGVLPIWFRDYLHAVQK